MKLILKIAAGIILASAVALIVRIVFLNIMLDRANEIARESMEKQKQAIAARDERVRQEGLLIAERERKAKEIARQEAEYERKKANAWRNYYVDPEGCLVFKSDAHMVECVDNKKKARNEFNRLYEQGELR